MMMKTWWIVSSVDEEDSGAGQGGQGVGHLADSGVVDESSKEEQKAWREKNKQKQWHTIKCAIGNNLMTKTNR